ncbi:MAG: ABC transporter ATP-binding protein/permease [Bacteroides sp.]|nr:ABC transporter ATP-binding protein/permease [Eubacterium sp.]MCM1417987.1 ABC transporter ATP-binding protein/permease [Roseburia sp.]MCM1461766.1 ABC transporter ATP-binding protein/permease [Bacteroides sp.]
MIKTLAKRIGEFKKATILTPLCMVGEVLMEVIIPWLMALLIDNGVNGNGGEGDFNYILATGGLLVVCCAISLAAGFGGGKFGAIASTGFARNLRRDMFHKVQEYSFANIDKFSTASLVTRLTSDVTRVQDAFQMIIRIAVRAPMTLLFSLFAAFAINAELSVIFVAAIPILGVGLFIIMRKAHPVFERVFKRYDKLNSVVQENVSGMRVVKAFVREDYEVEKFKKVSKSIYDDFCYAEKVLAFNSPLMQFCVYAGMLIVAWLGAQLIVVDGTLKTGELMSVITYAMQVLMSLMMLSMIFVMLTMARASAERICEVLDEESTLKNRADPLGEVPDGSIRFNNVSFAYREGGEYSLSGIDLTIRSGETVGIIGGTGSSKSTLVQLIPRLYDVSEGSIEIGGRDVRDYDIETLRNAVAMVLQKNVLFSGTIKENLRWGNPDATDEELVHACRLAQADSFIASFPDGYDTYIEQGGTNVSGGQKQRLCIARALLKKPKILILDDSTSAVDTATDAMIRKAFREEIPDTTKLIIAQRISSVQDADKIIVLEGGKVHGFGTHDELLKTNDIYREVYYSQQKGSEKNAETE